MTFLRSIVLWLSCTLMQIQSGWTVPLKVGRTQNKQNEILIMALTSPNIKQMVAKEIPRLGSRSSEQIFCLNT